MTYTTVYATFRCFLLDFHVFFLPLANFVATFGVWSLRCRRFTAALVLSPRCPVRAISVRAFYNSPSISPASYAGSLFPRSIGPSIYRSLDLSISRYLDISITRSLDLSEKGAALQPLPLCIRQVWRIPYSPISSGPPRISNSWGERERPGNYR